MQNTLMEELHSSVRQLRARIWKRADGLCSVEVERFVSGAKEHEEPSHWSRVNHAAIVADSLVTARRLAQEELYCIER